MGKDGQKIVELNRRRAIHERCLNCKAWYPKEVANCTITNCPLFPYRTAKGKQNASQRGKAIKKYCLSCSNGQVGEVTKCTAPDCPLFIYRKGGVERAMKIPSSGKLKHREAFFINTLQRE